MNSRIPAAPRREKNSRNGSTTASFSVLGLFAASSGSGARREATIPTTREPAIRR
jgi:hypothetical protein